MHYLSHHKQVRRGFTILFAVLVASIILAVVVSVMNIALKQLKFSGIGRESQFAYYAADTGVECALFWDFRSKELLGDILFATSSQSTMNIDPLSIVGDGSNITCGRNQIYNVGDFDVYSNSTSRATTNFQFEIQSVIDGVARPFCTKVTVLKEYNSARERILTTVSSRGYNDACNPTIRDRYERGLEVKY